MRLEALVETGTGAGGNSGAMTSNDSLPGVAPGGGGGYDLGNRAGGAGGAGLLSALLALVAWGTLRKKI